MSIACTRINDEPLSPDLLGYEKEPNVFNSIFHKRDGASLHQIENETNIVSPAVLENPAGLPCQQPQNQDEAYDACTYLGKHELSCSAMTHG